MPSMQKPRVTLLVDQPNWAFDHVARSVVRRLGHRFKFSIKYVGLNDELDPTQTDLLHVFFWGETHYKQFGFRDDQIIKLVSSLRWKYEEPFGFLSAEAFTTKYLSDCSCVVTPSRTIFDHLENRPKELFYLPNGVETRFFTPPSKARSAPALTIGWVGNPGDLTKGLKDILAPAAEGHLFRSTDGQVSHRGLARFYKEIDVLAIGSIAEGEPIPLLESFASGCFPVATNVGLIPELVSHGRNGLIVERSVEAFKEAFGWCFEHLAEIRQSGQKNRAIALQRSWDVQVRRYDDVYSYAYAKLAGRSTPRLSASVSVDAGAALDGYKDDQPGPLLLQPSNLSLLLTQTWSLFWLGTRFAPGYRARFRTSRLGRVIGRLTGRRPAARAGSSSQ